MDIKCGLLNNLWTLVLLIKISLDWKKVFRRLRSQHANIFSMHLQGQVWEVVCLLYLHVISDVAVFSHYSHFVGLLLFCRTVSSLAEFSRSPAWADGPMVISSDESIAVLAIALLGNCASLCNWTQKKLTVALILRWCPEDPVKLASDLCAEL